MTILNPIFLQHGIHFNTSEPVKLQGILHVHSRYTGMNLMLNWSLPFRIFLGFSRTIVCLLLFFLWVLLHVFSIFCMTSFANRNCLQHQETTPFSTVPEASH